MSITRASLLASLMVMAAAAHAAASEDSPAKPEASANTAAAAPAEEDDAAEKPARKPKTFPKLAHPTLSHHLQFGLALFSGSGYRGIFPYQENVFCGQLKDNMFKRVCSGRIPVFVDVQASFGFAAHWDLLIDLRFGVERDFSGSRQLAIAPGFRYWVEPESSVKFFTTVQVIYDATGEADNVRQSDFGVRNANGLMFEVMRNLGFYAQFGETIGFVRWLRFEIDFGVGVQARFP